MKIAVVIPCFKVSTSLRAVLEAIGPEVSLIIVVDDACPHGSAEIAEERQIYDPRISIIRHQENQGVGGAMITGYLAALDSKSEIIVKLDGDGQMDPNNIPQIIRPLQDRTADYVKGNRFYTPDLAKEMPMGRLIGNVALSFITKMSSGYWNLFDPTNDQTTTIQHLRN